LRYAARVNGLTRLVVTKLDILSGLPEIKVCVGYEINGKQVQHFPSDLTVLARCQPIYETLSGWDEDVTGARTMAELPANAQAYIQFIADHVKVPVPLISVGPARAQMVDNGM
jgi:adenylosuccinate synthase